MRSSTPARPFRDQAGRSHCDDRCHPDRRHRRRRRLRLSADRHDRRHRRHCRQGRQRHRAGRRQGLGHRHHRDHARRGLPHPRHQEVRRHPARYRRVAGQRSRPVHPGRRAGHHHLPRHRLLRDRRRPVPDEVPPRPAAPPCCAATFSCRPASCPARRSPWATRTSIPTKPDAPIARRYTAVSTSRTTSGPTIMATKNRPVRVLFRNLLPTGVDGDLFLPVDTTVMGAGAGPKMMTLDANGVPDGHGGRQEQPAGRRPQPDVRADARSRPPATPRTAPPCTCTAASPPGSATAPRTSGPPRAARTPPTPRASASATCPTCPTPAPARRRSSTPTSRARG